MARVFSRGIKRQEQLLVFIKTVGVQRCLYLHIETIATAGRVTEENWPAPFITLSPVFKGLANAE